LDRLIDPVETIRKATGLPIMVSPGVIPEYVLERHISHFFCVDGGCRAPARLTGVILSNQNQPTGPSA
jgi:hypothetical protein